MHQFSQASEGIKKKNFFVSSLIKKIFYFLFLKKHLKIVFEVALFGVKLLIE